MLALLLTGACSSRPPEEPKDYVGKIAAERAAKDAAFAASDDPIPKARHAEFLPLAYFPIDPDYNAPGVLKPIDDKTVYEMPTSTGALEPPLVSPDPCRNRMTGYSLSPL